MARTSGSLSPSSCPLTAPDADWDGRIAALDGLRAAAMLLGVCLHGSVSYMTERVPGLIWLVRDKSCHPFFDLLFWWLHAFRLPLFFFLAGFFAAWVESARGPGGLMAHRFRRVLLPFLVGCLVILPVSYYIWTAGCLVTNQCKMRHILAIKFRGELQRELFGPLHLWFLQDLFLLNIAFAVYRWLAKTIRRLRFRLVFNRRLRFRLVRLLREGLPLWLSVPTALVLAIDIHPLMVHHNSFVPDGWRLLYYGLFFIFGATVYPIRKHLAAICRSWGFYLMLSLPLTAVLLWLVQRHLDHPDYWGTRWVLAATFSHLAWLLLFGFLGFALRYGNSHRTRLRYLADASYWVYLCHLPLVGLIQLDLDGIAWPAGIKFLVVVGLTTLLALASYETLVRYTILGVFLHGRRRRVTSDEWRVARVRFFSLATRHSSLATR